MEPQAIDVCVVGGGLAGLATAMAFARAGASVVLLERRTEAGDPHRGDVLRPAAVALLKKWGVTFEKRNPFEITSVEIEFGLHRVASRPIKGEPALCMPHTQLEAALREAAKAAGVDVRLGWQLQVVMHANGRVSGVTAISGIDAAAFTTKLVVGADGRSSTVRESLGLSYKAVEKTNEMLALEADLAMGVSPPRTDRLVCSIGPEGGGFGTPVAQRRMRVVTWTNIGEADALVRKTVAQLAQEVPARSPLPLGATIDPTRLRSYELTGSGHAQNYAAPGAVCVGDAVHAPPNPSTEGMQMALFDAEALVRYVGPALRESERAVDKALIRFETERWPDNQRRIERARAAMKWLMPLKGFRRFLARTPLARFFLGGLLATD